MSGAGDAVTAPAAAAAPARAAVGLAFGGAAACAALDQLSKRWIVGHLSPLDAITVVPGWLSLILSTNEGVVFGLASSGPLRPLATLALPALLVPALVWLLWTSRRRLERIAYALILGGAIGNLVDRFRLGHVIDFIDAYWRRAGGIEHHWYTFNLADSFICVGGGLLAIAWMTTKAPAPPASAKC